jgi:hypothetical protein
MGDSRNMGKEKCSERNRDTMRFLESSPDKEA